MITHTGISRAPERSITRLPYITERKFGYALQLINCNASKVPEFICIRQPRPYQSNKEQLFQILQQLVSICEFTTYKLDFTCR